MWGVPLASPPQASPSSLHTLSKPKVTLAQFGRCPQGMRGPSAPLTSWSLLSLRFWSHSLLPCELFNALKKMFLFYPALFVFFFSRSWHRPPCCQKWKSLHISPPSLIPGPERPLPISQKEIPRPRRVWEGEEESTPRPLKKP